MNGPVDVFVVWEPVLVTDVVAPSTNTLRRVRDGRAWQLWDRRHIVSDSLKPVLAGQRVPKDGFDGNKRSKLDVLWDAVAIFPPGTLWENSPPPPVYFDGDVDVVAEAFKRKLQEVSAARYVR